MDKEDSIAQRHLIIAGTGRAGTSFLVRYLTELGLDTHLSRRGSYAGWDEDANAGLEDAPLSWLGNDLPYVVKSPFLYQFIDEVLTTATLKLDAVVIPVRDLNEAAVSRSLLERRAIHQNAPWMTTFEQSWEEWAHVPGGIIYSLNPIDQGRLLAVGFHHLVQRLVAANIPIIFLAFPKFAENAAYLYDQLRSILPQTVDRTMACSAHQRVADPAKIRVGTEIGTERSWTEASSVKTVRYEAHRTLDAIAVRRELERLRGQLAEMSSAVAAAEKKVSLEQAAAAEERRPLLERIVMLETALAKSVAAVEQANCEKAEAVRGLREATCQYSQRVQHLTQEMIALRQHASMAGEQAAIAAEQVALTADQKRQLELTLAAMRTSRSWSLTRPYRAIGKMLHGVYASNRKRDFSPSG